jgi:hypothetical protein
MSYDEWLGTEDGAKRWRLMVQGIVKDLDHADERFLDYWSDGSKHRVWTLLNRKDGTRFATFEEFCEYECPWGLGTSHGKIRAHLEALQGKRAVDLIAVPPERKRGPNGGVTHHDGEKRTPGTDQRLRAILRAPPEIQELYREGLIAQTLAAKLGPRKTDPDTARRNAEIVEAVRDIKTQRKVNDTVRTMLGEKNDPVARILRQIEKLTPTQRRRLREANW